MWRKENDRLGDLALLYAHAVMVHAASVSRLLWPSKPQGTNHPYTEKQRKRRGERMRAALGVTGDSPLKNCDLRHHFEHFDERLEVVYSTPEGRRLDIVDLNRIPFGLSTPDALLLPLRMFEAGRFRVMGTLYDLPPIIDELKRVGGRADGWLAEHRHLLRGDERRARATAGEGEKGPTIEP